MQLTGNSTQHFLNFIISAPCRPARPSPLAAALELSLPRAGPAGAPAMETTQDVTEGAAAVLAPPRRVLQAAGSLLQGRAGRAAVQGFLQHQAPPHAGPRPALV